MKKVFIIALVFLCHWASAQKIFVNSKNNKAKAAVQDWQKANDFAVAYKKRLLRT